MKNSRYFLIVVIRIILISLSCFALIWLFINTHRPATTFFVLILTIFQIAGLINYHNQVQRDLANFLVFLEENDPSLAFSASRIEKNFKGLVYQLDIINKKLQNARIEKEIQYYYLQNIIKQVDTGIIAFDLDGKIEIINQAAKDQLGIKNAKNIKTLTRLYPELENIFNNSYKKFNSPVRIKVNNINQVFSVKVISLKMEQRKIRLLSLHNIKAELEAEELDAWRKLIRIQRHEIINSITPITTLTAAIKRRFIKNNDYITIKNLKVEDIEDVISSVNVIEERSLGLIDFVERFKNITNLPVIKIEPVVIQNILDRIAILFSKEFSLKKIILNTVVIPADLIIHCDEKLIEHVLINLIRNSTEAIHDSSGEIKIRVLKGDGNTIIRVIDNGKGINEKIINSIFIPSFTTKENGSGIGLSISRQIIQMHNGKISVKSLPDIETVFEINLPDDNG